jgi:hypothetical protein
VAEDTDFLIDLQYQELKIKTESRLGSGDMMRINLYTETGEYIGNVQIMFDDQMKYHIGWCSVTYSNRFDKTPSVTNPSTWRIKKDGSSNLRIWCNDELVLTYTFASSSRSTCVSRYSKDVGKIVWGSQDTASKLYKPVKGMYAILNFHGSDRLIVW